jgi:dynein heavy chain
MSDSIARKSYDCLDAKQRTFEADYDKFNERLNLLIGRIRKMLEKLFSAVWSSAHLGMSFLARFEKLSERVPGLDIDAKCSAILATYSRTLDRVKLTYNRYKENPPVPRNMPPVAGRIWWTRGLFEQIAGPMRQFKQHTRILKQPGAGKLMQRYLLISRAIVEYEVLLHDMWSGESVSL